MAKNSNKKVRRTRSNQKAAKIRDVIAREKRRDKFDDDIRKDRMVRSNFYTIIRDACYNPDHYCYHEDYSGTSIVNIANIIKNKNLSSNEKASLSKLIEVTKRSKMMDNGSCENYIIGLINLTKWHWLWEKDPDFWHPTSKNSDKQFSSLVDFTLCKYEVPEFFNKVWYSNDGNNHLYQEWYINLGRGENIRKQKHLPIDLTKKMAHHFLTARASFSVNEAIRWGQIKGMGGNDRTAMAILATPLGQGFESNEFWTSVIRFFIENPMLDTYQYGPIFDYISDQKYRDRGNVFVDDELVNLGPPQPNFSMHRRDPNALLRHVEEWHRNIRREQTHRGYSLQDSSWKSCGIPGFVKKIKKVTTSIEELLTSKDLYADGEKMKHCVGSYVNSCSAHLSAIYSLRRFEDDLMYREATIEVDIAQRMITQARKSCNRPLTKADWSDIREWRNKTDLKLSSWLG